jgi:hypothetical protein
VVGAPVAELVAPQNNGIAPKPAMVPSNGPVRFGPDPTEDSSAGQDSSNPLTQMLPQLMQSLGVGGAAGGGGAGTGGSGSGNVSSSGPQYVSKGALESCPQSLPPNVWGAYKEAQQFRSQCGLANRGDKQKIVINDYSCDGTPTMWIFDAHGNCVAKTAVTFGAGEGGNGSAGGCPRACSDGGEHATPPGFHLTGYHHQGDSKYGPGNSMEMIGLEGQRSSGSSRGILIHQAASPGSPSSWGCSGVCYDCYGKVKELLGFGALVYNYFGSPPHKTSTCNSGAGFSHSVSCQMDRAAPEIGSNSLPAADTLRPDVFKSDGGGSDTSQ